MRPIRFVSERIDVELKAPGLPEKRPGCPSSFTWAGETFIVVECLNEWRDYERKGRMARNMMPQHSARAEQTGSWGVGRYYHRVRTDSGRVFDVYYDRAPSGATGRKGGWFLFRELAEEGTESAGGEKPGFDTQDGEKRGGAAYGDEASDEAGGGQS